MITNAQTRTNVHEIADGIYRINTPFDFPDGQGFSFNQYLLVDDEPLMFHTGPRQLFAAVREAVAAVLPVERLRYVGLSHFEADECGSLNQWLAAAPAAVPLCSRIAAMVGVHTLIGIGEGIITALTVGVVLGVRPDLVYGAADLQTPLVLGPKSGGTVEEVR